MPGQPLRHTPFAGDDVDVDIAVVLAGEGDPLSVRREARIAFDAGMRGEPPHVRAVELRHPEVVRVRERDTIAGEGGLGEEAGVVDVDGESGEGGEQKDREQSVSHGANISRGRRHPERERGTWAARAARRPPAQVPRSRSG